MTTRSRLLLCLAAILGLCSTALASGSNPPKGASAEAAPHIAVPRLSGAPGLADFAGMKPATPLAQEMAKVDKFVERIPEEYTEPSVRTEAYFGYTNDALFIVFLAFDPDPSQLRARLGRREDVDDDDQVGFWLDTFDDHQHTTFFFINSYGVQQEGAFGVGEPITTAYDTVWKSYADTNQLGYIGIFELPFRSMRFKPGKPWGILLERAHRRISEYSFYPAVPQTTPNFMLYTGKLTGIDNVSPGRNLQFIPYISYRNYRGLDTTNFSSPRFVTTREPDAGLDAKAVIKDSLVLDATINPDFGQVESDEPQATTNERFEVIFPEKRPFFQENSGYFLTPYNLAFTRRIVDPSFGVRLTGKLQKWSVGALVANDESPGKIVPLGDPLRGKDALFGLARISREFSQDTSVGFIFAGRSLDVQPGSACVSRACRAENHWTTGLDAHLRFNRTWDTTLQALRQSTDYIGIGTRPAHAYYASIQGVTRNNSLVAQYRDKSEDWVSLTGTFERPDVRRFNTQYSHRFWSEKILNHGPIIRTDSIWDQNGTRLQHFGEFTYQWRFGRQTDLQVYTNYEEEALRPQDFPALARVTDFNHRQFGVFMTSAALSWLTFNTRFVWGTDTNFSPASGVPELVDTQLIQGTGIFRLGKRTTVENTYIRTALRDPESDLVVVDDHAIRSKLNYQFTREFSLRLITQYNATLANQSFIALERAKRLNFDVLFSYLVHPGTVVYVGYNSDFQNYDPALTDNPTFPGTLNRVRGLEVNDGNQLFVKVSYLFRF